MRLPFLSAGIPGLSPWATRASHGNPTGLAGGHTGDVKENSRVSLPGALRAPCRNTFTHRLARVFAGKPFFKIRSNP